MRLSWQITLVKSGGGFFPLHRFESAHTAFLIIVRRFCLANNLEEENLTITIKVPLCFPVEATSQAKNVRLRGYLLHQRGQYVAVYDKVSAFCAVSCYVSQGPHRLRVKQLFKSNNKNNMKNYNFNQFKFDLNKLPEVSEHQER